MRQGGGAWARATGGGIGIDSSTTWEVGEVGLGRREGSQGKETETEYVGWVHAAVEAGIPYVLLLTKRCRQESAT